MLPFTIFLLFAGVSLAFPTSEQSVTEDDDVSDDIPVENDDGTSNPSTIVVNYGDNIVGSPEADTIAFEEAGATVSAGAGDDIIIGPDELQFTDGTTILGGDGDDTIDVTNIVNLTVSGGNGDDEIHVRGASSPGAGYILEVDGGAGNDEITADIGGLTFSGAESPGSLTGGEGEDSFILNVDPILTYSNGPVAEYPYQYDFSNTPEDGLIELESIVIEDFVSGVDSLIVDGASDIEGFTLTEAVLDAENTSGQSYLILFYDQEDEDRDTLAVHIDLNGAAVEPSDIEFIGGTIPTLVVV